MARRALSTYDELFTKEDTRHHELVTDRIRTHAERLRLTHIAETADALIERAEKSEMGYREFLDSRSRTRSG